MLRAVSTPIAGPVDGTWEELRPALAECWRGSTRLSNWAASELYKADVVRTPDMDRLPKFPGFYLYPGARALCPDVDTSSVVAILHAVEGKYRKSRLDLIWRNAISLPNFRYPVPYPIHNQSWNATVGPGGEPLISARIGGRRWTLRLRAGDQFRRQLVAHRQIATGVALAGELAIYAVPENGGDHRPAVGVRHPGGGRSRTARVMAKMVAWFPRVEPGVRSGTLHVRTAPESFWTYHVGLDGEIKYLHADNVRRWIAEHRRRVFRMADDLKHEKRWPKAVRMRMVESHEASIRKMHNRLDSFCHESAAMLAGFARRAGVATVMYDDSDKSYAPEEKFPWYKLRTMLAYKLDAFGIEFDPVGAGGQAGRADD